MTHDDIWRAIDSMANENKMSCSRMACVGGLNATTFNKSKRVNEYGKERWVSMQSLVKVLNAMNLPMMYFAAFVDAHAANREKSK